MSSVKYKFTLFMCFSSCNFFFIIFFLWSIKTYVFFKLYIVNSIGSIFCNVILLLSSFTAEHTFGRVESQYSFSASNIFKLDPLHALIVAKQHDPLHFTMDKFLDFMRLTVVWIKKAHKSFPEARFAAFIWDVLPKCGASQVHPHIQAILDKTRYHGE